MRPSASMPFRCIAALVVLTGCGGDDGPPPEGEGTGRVAVPGFVEPTTASRCAPSSKKSCKVITAEFNGVQSCFVGESTCTDDGAWGPCQKADRPAKK